MTVKTKVLGKGLRDNHVRSWLLLVKVADGPGVFRGTAGCEALVGGVEKGEQLLSLTDLSDDLPLLLCGIKTGRVVCTCVQQDGIARLSFFLKSLDHTLKVQRTIRLFVVGIQLGLESNRLPDHVVVRPGRVRHPDILRSKVIRDETSTDMVRSGSGDGLYGSDAQLILMGKNKIPRKLEELLVSLDGKIIVSGQASLFKEILLHAGDNVKRPGFAFVGAVDADTEVDAVRVRVFPVSTEKIKDLVCRLWW
ncbi:hypothetical protein HG531_010610 [Fusarium graminearum]|nr:hypothetical protein HG531_010610 [Fusarium graminearum]